MAVLSISEIAPSIIRRESERVVTIFFIIFFSYPLPLEITPILYIVNNYPTINMKFSAIAVILMSAIANGDAAPLRKLGSDNGPPYGPPDKDYSCVSDDPIEVLAKLQVIKTITLWAISEAPAAARNGDGTLDVDTLALWAKKALTPDVDSAFFDLIEAADENEDGKITELEAATAMGILLKDKCAAEVNDAIKEYGLEAAFSRSPRGGTPGYGIGYGI